MVGNYYRGRNAQVGIAITIWTLSLLLSLSLSLSLDRHLVGAAIKMENLMGLDFATRDCKRGATFMYLTLLARIDVWSMYCHRCIFATFKHTHSECSIYRDRSLLWLLILRTMHISVSFSRRRPGRGKLMNFDTVTTRVTACERWIIRYHDISLIAYALLMIVKVITKLLRACTPRELMI